MDEQAKVNYFIYGLVNNLFSPCGDGYYHGIQVTITPKDLVDPVSLYDPISSFISHYIKCSCAFSQTANFGKINLKLVYRNAKFILNLNCSYEDNVTTMSIKNSINLSKAEAEIFIRKILEKELIFRDPRHNSIAAYENKELLSKDEFIECILKSQKRLICDIPKETSLTSKMFQLSEKAEKLLDDVINKKDFQLELLRTEYLSHFFIKVFGWYGSEQVIDITKEQMKNTLEVMIDHGYYFNESKYFVDYQYTLPFYMDVSNLINF